MSTKSDKEDEATTVASGSDVLFYHLERARLLDVLPSLLEKSLQRGWSVVVQAMTGRQVEELNNALWTNRDDSFLPHGAAGDGFVDKQPIYLTDTDDNPNNAAIRFFVDGAQPDDITGYERIVYLFDGHNEQAVVNARKQWKRFADEGQNATYWKQSDSGSWEKKA